VHKYPKPSSLTVIGAQDDDLNFLPSSSPSTFSIRRKPKAPKGEFLKWDTTEVANHLALMELRAYNKIRPHECMSWTRSTKGPAVIHLTNFINMSDRLAAWVKLSILTCEGLGKRADMIDHWIKIAEVRNRLSARTILDTTPLSCGFIISRADIETSRLRSIALPGFEQHILNERNCGGFVRWRC
jgi:hypothetical protein